jgi:hypothetical protein
MPDSSRGVIVSVLITALFIGGSLFYLQFKKGSTTVTPTPAPSGSPRAYVPTLGGEQYNLGERMAKLAAPEVVTRTVIKRTDLPEPIAELVKLDAQKLEIYKATYKNNKIGWIITWTASDSLKNAHQYFSGLLIESNGWKKLYGARGNFFAITEAQHAAYNVRALLTQADPAITITDTKIEVIVR